MARETTHITSTTVNRALRAAANGLGNFEIGDTRLGGLTIRIRQRTATWAIRLRIAGRQTIRTIGSLDEFRDPETVRHLAARAKEMARDGVDPAELLLAARLEGSGELAAAETTALKRAGTVWTWEQLRNTFLDDTKARKRADTYRSYKSVLNLPDFAPLGGMLITEITSKHLLAVRQSLIDRGVATQAAAAVRTAKAAFSWAVEQPTSGLLRNPVADVKTKPRATSVQPIAALQYEDDGNGGKPLTEEELGTLPWAIGDYPNPAARLACMLVLATTQRRLTVVSALKDAFQEDPQTGYLVWKIHGGLNKGGRTHEIPLPPFARNIYECAKAISLPRSRWLFPKQRKRFASDDDSGHMNERTLNGVFYAAQEPGGRLAVPPGGKKLSPHDIRATFTSYMKEEHGCEDKDAALILQHSEVKGQTVTSRHYDRAKELERKYELLSLWEHYLQTAMTAHAVEE